MSYHSLETLLDAKELAGLIRVSIARMRKRGQGAAVSKGGPQGPLGALGHGCVARMTDAPRHAEKQPF